GVIGRRHAAIDRLLQNDFLDVVGREAAFRECGAHVQAEFIPLAERYQGADHEHAPRAMIEMRPGPDIAPGVAGDQVLEIAVERVAVGGRFVDPFIAEHLAALGHAVVAALVVVHLCLLSSLRGAERRSNPYLLYAVRWIASLRSQ